MTESQFCEIVDALLDFHEKAQENENCGPLGNDEVGLYRARDLARKYGFKQILEKLSFGYYDVTNSVTRNDVTAEEYISMRKQKLEKLYQESIDRRIKRLCISLGGISGYNIFCIENENKNTLIGNERTRLFGSMWRELSEDERNVYFNRAESLNLL